MSLPSSRYSNLSNRSEDIKLPPKLLTEVLKFWTTESLLELPGTNPALIPPLPPSIGNADITFEKQNKGKIKNKREIIFILFEDHLRRWKILRLTLLS